MVLLLLAHDLLDGPDGCFVSCAQCCDLMLQMAEHNPFDRHGGSRDGAASAKCGEESKHEAACATEVVAPATSDAAPLKLRFEDGAMPALVRLELGQLRQKIGSCEPRNEQLTAVDIDRAVLASMVDLEDPLAEGFGLTKTSAQFHATSAKVSGPVRGPL